jgi:small subunit ribosomal protein S7
MLVIQILQGDKEAQEKAPKVLKDDIKNKSSAPSGTRSFSTSARRPVEAQAQELAQFKGTEIIGLEYPDAGFGHKFALPDIRSMTKLDNFKKRYDPVVDQVTKSLMRDGKLSKAQSVRSRVPSSFLAAFFFPPTHPLAPPSHSPPVKLSRQPG